jgi:hypothetical protein
MGSSRPSCREPENGHLVRVNSSGEFKPFDVDALLTPAQFADYLQVSEAWVRRRLGCLPGVIREGRKHVRIHPRTYLEKRLRK